MSELNGHGGYHENGGQGDSAPTPVIDPHHKRQSYIMLSRAVDVATDVPVEAMKGAALSAIKDMKDEDGRIRARAREFLLKLQDSGVAAAIGLDKMMRLDEGSATEHITHTTISLEFDDRS